MRKTVIWMVIIFVLLMVGRVEQLIVDEVQLLFAVGFDVSEGKDKYEATISAPTYEPDQSLNRKIVSAKSNTSKGLRHKLGSELERPFAIGKLSMVLLSEEVAKKGVITLLDSFLREPSVGSRAHIAVVEGDIKELLQGEFSRSEDIGMYLSEIILQNMNIGYLPESNIHLFNYAYHEDGADPYLPIFKAKEDTAQIMGLALFQDDRYVDKLELNDVYLFSMLHEGVNQGNYEFSLDKDQFVTVQNNGSSIKYQLPKSGEKPTIKGELSMKATVIEYSGEEVTGQQEKLIKKRLEETLKNNGEEMIRSFVDKGIDPLGFGAKAHNQFGGWAVDKWYEVYPDVEISLQVTVEILSTGALG
ncbi:Ger(x)C family spore germination protein [Mechercharimyces sp. CAU 1602]|uniref:Ger(x)C family spore germination protein n=1 Tax=Mechercharimyces sp. CAU 1602 TaxID=2973933 RepID=UPI002162B67E|nr:Ger(x)C family spore germination protein [Mechercharimyces sp. CAU 1602]MCS1352177.1 Ger(x)C family spore germination protein [Mechercharimyces sp. CAU 1602]